MLWLIIFSTALGIFVGYSVNLPEKIYKATDDSMLYCMYALVAVMGVKIGLDETLFSYIGIVGVQSLVLALAAMLGSMVLTWVFEQVVFRLCRINIYGENVANDQEHKSPAKMTTIVFSYMILGVVVARMLPVLKGLIPYMDAIVTVGLCIMVFIAGLGMGKSRDLLSNIKKSGIGLIIVPIATIIGSIIAGMLVAPFLGISIAQGGVVGGSCGWYTLPGMVLTSVSAKLGALAFLTNMFREALSFVVVPLVAKRFGPFVATAPCGATAMDTTMPIIVKSSTPASAIIAFSSGLIISLAVPVMLNIFMPFL